MTNYDASDRRHVRLATKAAERAERERKQFVAGVMSTSGGRSWMLELLEGCCVFATTFNGNALQTAFNEGQRNVGLRLLNEIMRICPDQYVVMMRERNVREVTEDARRNQSNNDASGDGADDDTTENLTLVASDGRPFVEPGDD